jgi:hypothetical protein
VTVVSTIRTQPPMIADELRRQADRFLDLVELQPRIARDPSPAAAAYRGEESARGAGGGGGMATAGGAAAPDDDGDDEFEG